MSDFDIKEYPEDYKGPKRYVRVAGIGIIPIIYTYYAGTGYKLHPEYGGEPFESKRTGSNIQVMRDIGEYTSVVDGERITSRSAHREHIRRHDLIEVGNERVGNMDFRDSGPRIGHDIKRAIEQLRSRG